MRPSKATIIIFSCFLICLCVFVSKCLIFLSSLDPDTDFVTNYENQKYPTIGKSPENLVWMMQISDLHLSAFHDPSRITELKQFCNSTLDIIRPSVVLATGDLTDAKTPDGEGSTQFEIEWITYRDILYDTNIPNKVLWLDIRGNHDNFDVLCINSENNFFRKYSIQGPEHPRSYFYIHEISNDEKIGFLGVDACLKIGARRPFNFVGQLTSEEMSIINTYVQESRNMNVSYMIWFGHYPTSTIQYPESEKLRKLIANDERTVAYLCGHLHQIGGLVPKMYAHQKEGYLELELGDWRGNRMIRLMAIDHGQFSFIDVKHGTWPVVLVTNPKDVILIHPGRSPFTPSISHIRILIFSPIQLIRVRRRIDDGAWVHCENVDGPLFVSEWTQSDFEVGLHTIEVEVRDKNEIITNHQHYFSLDGTRVKTKFLPRLFLMPNLGLMFYCLFTCSVVLCSLPLMVFRYLVRRNKVNEPFFLDVQCRCVIGTIRKLCILTYFDVFFYPLAFYPLYLLAGPWAIVYLVQNKLGVIFSWGLIADGTFIPSWITYPFGWIQNILHAFLIFHLAGSLDERYYNIVNKTETTSCYILKNFTRLLYDNIFYILVLLLQLWDTYNFWLSYGHLTLVFCPLKTWWIILAVWLKCSIHTISKERIMHVNRAWLSS